MGLDRPHASYCPKLVLLSALTSSIIGFRSVLHLEWAVLQARDSLADLSGLMAIAWLREISRWLSGGAGHERPQKSWIEL